MKRDSLDMLDAVDSRCACEVQEILRLSDEMPHDTDAVERAVKLDGPDEVRAAAESLPDGWWRDTIVRAAKRLQRFADKSDLVDYER